MMDSNPMTRTILIMAGGTGGHVMPGLAVAHEMRARAWNVVWMGNPDGMEATLVPRHGITMQAVRFGGLRGNLAAGKAHHPDRKSHHRQEDDGQPPAAPDG